MASATLLTAAVVSAVAGLSFMVVATRVSSHSVSPSNRVARIAHATWWGGMGGYLLLQGVLTALAADGRLDADLYRNTRILTIPLICASVWGISTYLVFLFTGARVAAVALASLYAAVASLFFVATFAAPAPDLEIHRWIVTLDDDAPLYKLVYVFVGLPPIAASIAYLALLGRIDDPIQRNRVKLVAVSILAYVAGGLVARLSASDFVIFLSLVPLGLAAAATALYAHRAPTSALRPQPVRSTPRLRAVPSPAMARRLRELV